MLLLLSCLKIHTFKPVLSMRRNHVTSEVAIICQLATILK